MRIRLPRFVGEWVVAERHGEVAIKVRLRLGELLIRSKLATTEQVSDALARQSADGGRLGETLVSMGVLRREELDAFVNRIPVEPSDIEATGISANELLAGLMKQIYTSKLESVREFTVASKLPLSIVLGLVRMAVGRKLLVATGTTTSYNAQNTTYMLTEEGRRWTVDALDQLRYAGPAPVTLTAYSEQVGLQKLTNDSVTRERIREAFGGMVFDEEVLEQVGPALNSGRAILLYGPPGNGKTSVALAMASLFSDVIYVPYAVTVDGQIIVVFDPTIHATVDDDELLAPVSHDDLDRRWVPCKRPFVVAGGELTLETVDLSYDASAHFYNAPMPMKATGGCFVVDDFGRQKVSPLQLLNRWIVPLENRFDFLKLHTGKSFSVPFDELVIFSTNLDPESFIDVAFLRRLPYKIRIGAPSLREYKTIFMRECAPHGLTLSDAVFDAIVKAITEELGMALAGFQPKFIVEQVLVMCRFLGVPARLEEPYVAAAMRNLSVKRVGQG